METGMQYETRTNVAGHVNEAHILVVRLLPHKEITLRSAAGIIHFDATFELKDDPDGGSTVTCELAFRFRNFVMDLARPILEGMARDRMKHDLQTLANQLCDEDER